MISAGGIPKGGLRAAHSRPDAIKHRPLLVAGDPSVQSNTIGLTFEPAMMLDILRNAVLPAARRAFGFRFSSYADAIAFLKKCGYSSLRALPQTFQKSYTTRMLKILKLRYPAFKKKLDRYFNRFSGKGSKAIPDSESAKLVYRTIYKQTSVSGGSGYSCPGSTAARPSPVPATPTRRPTPRPADGQIARQNALLAAVRAVYGASKSESYVTTILKTQKWSTLKQLGIVSRIQTAFGRLGYTSAANNTHVARRLVQKTLRNWKKSSSTARPSTSVVARKPMPRPVKPPPAANRPRPRQAGNQLALQNTLVAAVRKVYGASKSESYAVTVLKTQKWSTLTQLGVVAHIQAGFRRLGYTRAGSNSRLAQILVKKTLRNWGKSS